MIRKDRYVVLGAVLAVCVIWGACKQQRQPCLTPKVASLILETMHITTDTGTIFSDTSLPAAQFLALPTAGNADTFLFTQAAVFTISLSPTSNSCQWLFRADSVANSPRGTLFDTITFYYKRDLQFLSNACGYVNFYDLDSIRTSHFNIDSVHIINASVTNDISKKHVQVYIHPGF